MPNCGSACHKFCRLFGVSPAEAGKLLYIYLVEYQKNICELEGRVMFMIYEGYDFAMFRNYERPTERGGDSQAWNCQQAQG